MLHTSIFNNYLLEINQTVEVRGTDGVAFGIALLILIALPAVYFIFRYLKRSKTERPKRQPLWKTKKINLSIQKDRKYYPDYIRVRVLNTGNQDIDLNQPLLIFRNLWSKRKFRLRGTNRFSFYPLLLEPGRDHELTIDLNQFYKHDKRLKKYPRITISMSDISGKKFPSQSVMLRKTLFR